MGTIATSREILCEAMKNSERSGYSLYFSPMKKSKIVLTKATNNSGLGRCKNKSYEVSYKVTRTEQK